MPGGDVAAVEELLDLLAVDLGMACEVVDGWLTDEAPIRENADELARQRKVGRRMLCSIHFSGFRDNDFGIRLSVDKCEDLVDGLCAGWKVAIVQIAFDGSTISASKCEDLHQVGARELI